MHALSRGIQDSIAHPTWSLVQERHTPRRPVGYPEGTVLGREVSEGQLSVLSAEEAYEVFRKQIVRRNETLR